jgi:predicted RNase H-like nuclease (RuvC/YqgF family)
MSMECPFCAGEVDENALACKHCARDLRIPESLTEENRELKSKVKELRASIAEAELELDRLRARRSTWPFRLSRRVP